MSDTSSDRNGAAFVAAVVLAAGESKRMHHPKMILPWGDTTIIGKVVTVLDQSGVEEIIVVTGGSRLLVEDELHKLSVSVPLRFTYNPEFLVGEMLSSVQAGLNAISEFAQAALIVLGDQPQIERETVDTIIGEYSDANSTLVVPSYRMRRGHPWLIARSRWSEVLSLRSPNTLRDYLNLNANHIHYVNIASETILNDVDTPADYQQFLMKLG